MLLHGDLHHENIVLDQNRGYILIDPKGVVGDPVFELSRFILNEFRDTLSGDLYDEIEELIDILAGNLDISNRIIKQCLYIETVVWLCDELEKGESLEACSSLIDNVMHAEAILQRGLG